MAKRKKQKKTAAAKTWEKLSTQIFNKIKKELEKSFKVMPSGNVKKIKKELAGLKKRLQIKLKEELTKSFRVTPARKRKKSKK